MVSGGLQAPKVTLEGRVAGDRLRRAMHIGRDGPMTQAELARRTGIGNSTLGQYIQGARRLPIREAKRIEDATDIPAAFLMGLVDEQDMELLRAPREIRTALVQMIRSMAKKPPPSGGPAVELPFRAPREHALRRRARGR